MGKNYIQSLDLSPRPKRALCEFGILTVGALRKYLKEHGSRALSQYVDGIGRKSEAEILAVLASQEVVTKKAHAPDYFILGIWAEGIISGDEAMQRLVDGGYIAATHI